MLEVRNFDDTSEFNELIGFGFIPFTPALLQERITRTVDIYHNGNLAGNVSVVYQFKSATQDDYKKAEEENKKILATAN
jgi:hypothetical protein